MPSHVLGQHKLLLLMSRVCDLPLKDFPQRGVLDSLDAVDFTLRHGAPKQHLNHFIVLVRFGKRHELKEKRLV